MNKVINKYLISGFIKTIINVILIFLCIGIILNLFEEIEFFKDLDLGLSLPFILTLTFIPNLLIKLLPFIIFISAMWYFLHLRSNTDLLSLKVFGYSNLKIITILSLTAFIFGLITVIVFTPVTSAMIKFYENSKSQYAKDIDHLFSINKNGLWIKEFYEKKLLITNAKSFEGDYIYDLTIYEMGKNNKLLKRIESKKANVSNNIWELEEVKIYDFLDKSSIYIKEKHQVYSLFNSEKLNSFYKNLDTISFLELINDFDRLKERGYNETSLNKKLNSFLSLPVFLFLMVVLASIFTLGSVSRSQNLYYVFISIITCVVIYYFKDLSIALGQTNRVSLILSIWMPLIAVGLFCSIGILQINEK